MADIEQRKTNEMIGAELGYNYAHSPLIAREDEAPPYDYMEYTPTTLPGVRLPHVWLSDGTAMQDKIGYGHGYTLLRLARSPADTSGLQKAFTELGAPLQVLDVPDDHARGVYGFDYFLLRPDMHIVWRGNTPPAAPATLARQATGHALS
jgi:hypothetical protein